jgi:hypothetical protein
MTTPSRDRYNEHVREVEAALAVLVTQLAGHRKIVFDGIASGRQILPKGSKPNVIAEINCDNDPVTKAAKSKRDKHTRLAVMYGIGALLEHLEQDRYPGRAVLDAASDTER